jgi:hypothetical protein
MTEYRRDDRHVYREIAGEHLLIALHREAVAPMFAFTPTAASLWSRLDGWVTPDGLTDHLVSHFEVDRDLAERDVAEFLEQLLSIGALQSREVEQ